MNNTKNVYLELFIIAPQRVYFVTIITQILQIQFFLLLWFINLVSCKVIKAEGLQTETDRTARGKAYF
jgi:hypothetical protein